jgi:alkaline phosphatase D
MGGSIPGVLRAHAPEAFLGAPGPGHAAVQAHIAYGNLAEFNVLDTRQYRDDQAAGDGTDPPNPQQQDPARTLTGDAQERWLLDGLSASGSTWNVLAQQVFMSQRDFDISDAERYSMDAWDGYLGSRNRILGYIGERDIVNTVVLTGDVHNNWANNLKANFYDPGSETLGVEFVGTSITSGGDGTDTSAGNEAVVEENPHIEFFNGQRGYVRCALTPQEYRTDYRIVPYVKQPDAQIYTRASFITEAGNPGLQGVDEAPVPSRQASLIETDTERIRAQEKASRTGRR